MPPVDKGRHKCMHATVPYGDGEGVSIFWISWQRPRVGQPSTSHLCHFEIGQEAPTMSVSKRAAVVVFVVSSGFVAAERNITVHLDATYAIDQERGPICGGTGGDPVPTGTACPLKGDVAIANCYSNLPTYNGTECVAPVNAECVIDAESTWSCVFRDGAYSLDVEMGDLTSTLVVSNGALSMESPWGDLPWRAPPPLDSVLKTR